MTVTALFLLHSTGKKQESQVSDQAQSGEEGITQDWEGWPLGSILETSHPSTPPIPLCASIITSHVRL